MKTLTPTEVAKLQEYFDENDLPAIRRVVRLFDEFERALAILPVPGNDQWHEGYEHLRLAKQCFARAFADKIVIDGA